MGEALPSQGHYFNGGTLYKRFTPAGPDHAQVAASAGLADYVDALYSNLGGPHAEPHVRAAAVHDAMRAREVSLLTPLLGYLAAKNSVRVLGPGDAGKRAPTVALECDRPGEELAAALALHDINAGGGDFYAVRPLEAMGIDPAKGVLRLSFTHYTHEQEIERLISALDHVF